jgi:hypothetical protein
LHRQHKGCPPPRRFNGALPHPPERIWRTLTQGSLIEERLMKNDFEPVMAANYGWERFVTGLERVSAALHSCAGAFASLPLSLPGLTWQSTPGDSAYLEGGMPGSVRAGQQKGASVCVAAVARLWAGRILGRVDVA